MLRRRSSPGLVVVRRQSLFLSLYSTNQPTATHMCIPQPRRAAGPGEEGWSEVGEAPESAAAAAKDKAAMEEEAISFLFLRSIVARERERERAL